MFEEQFLLIRARNSDEAKSKAAAQAEADSTAAYTNDRGEKITWSIWRVLDAQAVPWEKLEDGAVLYARHFRDIGAYEKFEPFLKGTLDEPGT